MYTRHPPTPLLPAVVVEELVKGGNAEKVGVQVGDVVTETSALVLKAGKESEFENVGHGATPYNNCAPPPPPCRRATDTVRSSCPSEV